MWRSTVFSEAGNSDQSISDDDDLDGDFREDHVSLGIPPVEKGKLQILSQLDMLRDANEVMHERNQTSSHQNRLVDIYVEDDVEFPIFANNYTPQEASTCNSDEEILSDNEVGGNCMELSKIKPSSFRGNITDGICTWLAANAETEADDDDNCASFQHVTKRSCKGKPKSKFSFRAQLHKDHVFQDEQNKTKSTCEQLEDKTSVSLIDDDNRYIEDDNSDCLGSYSSEEDEKKHKIEGLKVVVPKQKTISDQFHEALGDSTNEEGHMYTGFGLYQKLQRVIQSTKERDLYFLNKSQKEDEASCFEVKILSKCREGKLAVCSCSCSCSFSSVANEEIWLGKNLTVIFSSRICSHVDVDVAMLVRIHSPWKEVNVKGKQENKTILCTYFSQI